MKDLAEVRRTSWVATIGAFSEVTGKEPSSFPTYLSQVLPKHCLSLSSDLTRCLFDIDSEIPNRKDGPKIALPMINTTLPIVEGSTMPAPLAPAVPKVQSRLTETQFAALWDHCLPYLRRRALAATSNTADAEEVCQEAFFRLLQQVEATDFDIPAPKLPAWLYGIFRNTLRERLRAQNRQLQRTSHLSIDEIPAPDSLPSDAEGMGDFIQKLLRLAQSSVSPRNWEIFMKMTLEGSGVDELAQQFGLSLGAVYQIRHRVRAFLRRQCELLGENQGRPPGQEFTARFA